MATTPANSTTSRPPNPIAMLFHTMKTFALTGSILNDRRVHPAAKAVFLSAMGILIAAALGIEGAAELVNAVPIVGQFLGLGELPIDAAVDWVVLSVAAFNLLKLFPASVVSEHYNQIFRSGKRQNPV